MSEDYLKNYKKTQMEEKINISKFNMEYGWNNSNGEFQSEKEGNQYSN